jgi:hypothetical protein
MLFYFGGNLLHLVHSSIKKVDKERTFNYQGGMEYIFWFFYDQALCYCYKLYYRMVGGVDMIQSVLESE